MKSRGNKRITCKKEIKRLISGLGESRDRKFLIIIHTMILRYTKEEWVK